MKRLELDVKYKLNQKLEQYELRSYCNRLRKALWSPQKLELYEKYDGRWVIYTPDNFKTDLYSGAVYLGELSEEQIIEYNSLFSKDDIVDIRFKHNGNDDCHNASMCIQITAEAWQCPKCNTFNDIDENKRCKHCGDPRILTLDNTKKWECNICNKKDNYKEYCPKCGVSKEYSSLIKNKIDVLENKIRGLENKIETLKTESNKQSDAMRKNDWRTGNENNEIDAIYEEQRRVRAEMDALGIDDEYYDDYIANPNNFK